jgi:outer membrane scaffolding protein for murein synthesis (MipA/OmpV family)
MLTRLLFASFFAAAPLAGYAGTLEEPAPAPVPTPPAISAPDLIFTLGGGVGVEPTYFGSDSYEAVPAFSFSLDYLRLPGGRSFGSTDPSYTATGLSPTFSFRVIKERSAADHVELTGLNDIDLSVELGMGLAYRQENFQVFANARYGVIGHEAWVGDIGADLIVRPTDKLTMTLGPRLFLANEDYAATYFGVTPAESLASGLPAFAPRGGALSAGVELGATYAINDTWGMFGAVRWDRLLNDAATSPITGLGSEDQFSARIGLTRRFTLDF